MIVASTLAIVSLVMPPVSIVSSASVALVTLRRGVTEGLIVLACSITVAALLGFFLLGNYQFVLLYGVVLWVPVWLISFILREGRYLSLAVEIAVLLGVLGVVGFYLYDSDLASMWKAMLVQMVPPNAPVEDVQHTLDTLSHYMTGIVAAASVFGLLFALFLGRWWQALLYNPGGFRQEFLSLKTHPRLAVGSIVVVVIASLSSGVIAEVSWNVAILLFVLYIFTGTAVLHTVFASMKMGRFIVPMFYVTLFLIPHAMLPVALVGLSDTWMNLRNKISNQQTP
ncbi:MAG: hypothetical protein U1E09_15305 [Methylococcales bacterium]|nr:hypothetical protein [Methylobacter sp.]MDP2426580.1 hypothetical protein [Methylobacter sp.]MDP3056745.1 hypothetical protein [Methylobacter sp.]MDP3362593.1 hypothetical protein [Methylobacter sp.]MDZ4157919.1 hypothetical protein [Methylococcales bacterium]